MHVKTAVSLQSWCRPKGVIVTYGGLSMKPVSIPTGLFIFKDIQARGFWLSGTTPPTAPLSGMMRYEEGAIQIELPSPGFLQPPPPPSVFDPEKASAAFVYDSHSIHGLCCMMLDVIYSNGRLWIGCTTMPWLSLAFGTKPWVSL
jgi:hypothetical protein